MSQVEQTSKPKNRKKFYKTAWFWAAVAIIIVIGTVSNRPTDEQKTVSQNSTSATVKSEPQKQSTAQAVDNTPKKEIPAEHKSALSQANTYANMMHMSKKGVYDQLVSEYGGKFTAQAAQYGIDNVQSDWNANALAKAKTYQDTMHLSPAAIRDQLTSEYGEKFTASEADYAIQHL